jgi:hypothetical protein
MKDGKNVLRPHLQKSIAAAFGPASENQPQVTFALESRTWPTWDRDDEGRVWILQPFTTHVTSADEKMRVNVDGMVKLRTRRPLSPEQMTNLPPAIEWEVAGFNVERIKVRKADVN